MKTLLLVVGKNKEILTIVVRVLNAREEYKAEGTEDVENAIELFSSNHYDLVLLSSGLSEADEAKIRETFKKLKPSVQVIQHYGGGSGLLFNEIQHALENHTL